jgi:hypothetical protein
MSDRRGFQGRIVHRIRLPFLARVRFTKSAAALRPTTAKKHSAECSSAASLSMARAIHRGVAVEMDDHAVEDGGVCFIGGREIDYGGRTSCYDVYRVLGASFDRFRSDAQCG